MSELPPNDRLAELEARVAALEQAIGRRAVPPPWPTNPPTNPQPSAKPTAPLPKPAAARRDFERLLGLSVLGRIGIGALLLAAAYFGQLGWTQLGPSGKVASIYALGGALLGLGAWLRSRVAVRYVALLWGGGCAACYLAAAFAHLRFALFGSGTALTALLLATAMAQFLARSLRREAMAAIALSGSFVAPLLIHARPDAPTPWFVLAAVLHGWAAWTEHAWQWRWARLTGVCGACMLALVWYAPLQAPLVWSDVQHVELLLLLVAAPELGRAWLQRRSHIHRWLALAATVSLVQFALLLGTGPNPDCRYFSLSAAIVLLCGGIAYNQRAASLGDAFARLGSVLLPIGALFLAHHATRNEFGTVQRSLVYAASQAAVAVGLTLLRPHARAVDLGVAAAMLIAAFSSQMRIALQGSDRAIVALCCVPALLLVLFARTQLASASAVVAGAMTILFGWASAPALRGSESQWTALGLAAATIPPLLGAMRASRRSERALAWTATSTLVLLATCWLVWTLEAPAPAPSSTLTPFWNARCGAVLALIVGTLLTRSRCALPDHVLRDILGACALALLYAGGLLETLEAVRSLADGWRAVTTSLYSLLFSSALLIAGFRQQVAALRWTGLSGFLLVAIKVIAYDLANVSTELRVLATGALGGVLLLGAWAYARRKSDQELPR